ncbi:hypothetical protein [Catellatospora vulcania]|uniref:hypothetical protein n=1 Tax=Catellatospora vulcania TaxID=1460450 RepID=UPI0012D44BD6|nr:hypothetical protein [Catellatospora vulcania]
MTLGEQAPSPLPRRPARTRGIVVAGAVVACLALAAGITAYAGGFSADTTSPAVEPPAFVAVTQSAPASVTPGASAVASPSPVVPSPTAKPSPSRAPKPSPKPKLVLKKITVTAVKSGGNVVATIKVTATGYGSETIEVIFFFAGSGDVQRNFTFTGTGGNTVTKKITVPDRCSPGYTGSVIASVQGDTSVQDSVDIC